MRIAGLLWTFAATLALAAPSAPATAQTYPTRTITLVVAFPPGGATDVIARAIVDSMSQTLGQQIVIEHVGGAGGPSEHAGTRPLECAACRRRAPRSRQLLQVRDMDVDPVTYRPQVCPDLRMVSQSLDLARHSLLDMLLEGKHVCDIAVDGVCWTAL